MYNISREAFASVPPSPVFPYKFRERVDRGNFTSYTILSFRLSRGSPWAQRVVWQFTKEQTGFDFYKTYENYLTSGGRNCLSLGEREMIVKAYILAGHRGVYERPLDLSLYSDVFKELTLLGYDKQIGGVLDRTSLSLEEADRLSTGGLKDMLSLTQARIAALRRTT